jgi:hypothetical protein
VAVVQAAVAVGAAVVAAVAAVIAVVAAVGRVSRGKHYCGELASAIQCGSHRRKSLGGRRSTLKHSVPLWNIAFWNIAF